MLANGIENAGSERNKRYSNDTEAKSEGIGSDCPRMVREFMAGTRNELRTQTIDTVIDFMQSRLAQIVQKQGID
jgi:hypothetical protein